MDKKQYTIEDLCGIVKQLRSENGCPWDREQTHESIRSALIEEAYEACDAIDHQDMEAMADELGDVLLQVVFHAQLGTEEGAFGLTDVVTNICEKMIRRHPHVFGTVNVENTDQVLLNWEEIKRGEKGIENHSQSLRDVVRCLPALVRAQKLQKKALKANDGFKFLFNSVENAKETLQELTEGQKRGKNIEEEIGMLLFSVVGLAREAGINAEEALEHTCETFICRFEQAEQFCQEKSLSMDNLDKDALLKVYQKAITAQKA